jgi:dihydrofolate reductase
MLEAEYVERIKAKEVKEQELQHVVKVTRGPRHIVVGRKTYEVVWDGT